jgi:hypothetical protein
LFVGPCGTFNSVLGGFDNSADGHYTVVCSGGYNHTTYVGNVILGGFNKLENAEYSVTIGGTNQADATFGPMYSINLQ